MGMQIHRCYSQDTFDEDFARRGFRKTSLRTVDTDGVVLAIVIVSELNLEELCVAFGTGKLQVHSCP